MMTLVRGLSPFKGQWKPLTSEYRENTAIIGQTRFTVEYSCKVYDQSTWKFLNLPESYK